MKGTATNAAPTPPAIAPLYTGGRPSPAILNATFTIAKTTKPPKMASVNIAMPATT